MMQKLAENTYGFFTGILILKEFAEHPIEDIPQIGSLIGEEPHHLVKVADEQQFVSRWVIEQLQVDIAKWLDLVERSREQQQTWQIVDQIMEELFMLRLGEFYEGFPETY